MSGRFLRLVDANFAEMLVALDRVNAIMLVRAQHASLPGSPAGHMVTVGMADGGQVTDLYISVDDYEALQGVRAAIEWSGLAMTTTRGEPRCLAVAQCRGTVAHAGEHQL